MSNSNFEELVTPTLVRNVFEDSLIGQDNKGWAIIVCGGLLSIGGKVFFKTKTQAVRAFYNFYRWRVCRALHAARYPSALPWEWWGSTSRSDYWKAFKGVLERDYGLKFIHL